MATAVSILLDQWSIGKQMITSFPLPHIEPWWLWWVYSDLGPLLNRYTGVLNTSTGSKVSYNAFFPPSTRSTCVPPVLDSLKLGPKTSTEYQQWQPESLWGLPGMSQISQPQRENQSEACRRCCCEPNPTTGLPYDTYCSYLEISTSEFCQSSLLVICNSPFPFMFYDILGPILSNIPGLMQLQCSPKWKELIFLSLEEASLTASATPPGAAHTLLA